MSAVGDIEAVGRTRPRTYNLVASVRAAFSSWWTVLGVGATSVTTFNLVAKVLDIGLSGVVSAVIERYYTWVHGPIRWACAWVSLPLPPEWAVDLALAWLMLGGIVLRAAWIGRCDVWSRGRPMWNFFIGLHGRPWTLPIFFVVSLLCWPMMLGLLRSAPLRFTHVEAGGHVVSVESTMLRSHMERHGYVVLYDVRLVLATQALGAAACVVAWLAVNALTS